MTQQVIDIWLGCLRDKGGNLVKRSEGVRHLASGDAAGRLLQTMPRAALAQMAELQHQRPAQQAPRGPAASQADALLVRALWCHREEALRQPPRAFSLKNKSRRDLSLIYQGNKSTGKGQCKGGNSTLPNRSHAEPVDGRAYVPSYHRLLSATIPTMEAGTIPKPAPPAWLPALSLLVHLILSAHPPPGNSWPETGASR